MDFRYLGIGGEYWVVHFLRLVGFTSANNWAHADDSVEHRSAGRHDGHYLDLGSHAQFAWLPYRPQITGHLKVRAQIT
jgi:hypothetical protein